MNEMLERDTWATFLADVTQKRRGATVAIEVLDPELGDEHEVQSLPLSSISYDPHDDVVVIELSSQDDPNDIVFRRLVEEPTSLAATPPDPAEVTAIKVENTGGITLFTLGNL